MPAKNVGVSFVGLNHLQDMVALVQEAVFGESSNCSHSFEMTRGKFLDLVRLGRPRVIELQKVLGPLDPLDVSLARSAWRGGLRGS